MSVETATAGGPKFSVGEVLSTSARVFGGNFWPFVLIAVILQIPVLLVQVYFAVPDTNGVPDLSATWTFIGLSMLVGAICGGLTNGTLVFGAFQDLRGQRAGIAACFSRALAVLPAIALGALAYGLLVGLGLILLVIPGIIIAVTYWVYAPAIVVERVGIGAAFTRSGSLTKGHRWGIFGIFLLIVIIAVFIEFAIGFVAALLGVLGSPVGITILIFLLNSVVGAYFAVVNAVGYYYLRAEKEGVDIDQIAQLFD